MINPKISWTSEEKISVGDSCYSFDVAFFVEIQRYQKIKVEYQEGKKKRISIFFNP